MYQKRQTYWGFSLFLSFFSNFTIKFQTGSPAVLNDATICGVMEDDRGCCHGAGMGGKKAAYDSRRIEQKASTGAAVVHDAGGP